MTTTAKSNIAHSVDGQGLGAERELAERRRLNYERAQRAAAEALRVLRARRQRREHTTRQA